MPSGSIDPHQDYVADLHKAAGREWPMIALGQADALAVREILHRELRSFTSDDVDLVVFGSLARGEWTSGSDVDWTMLIDGQANSQHRVVAREVERVLARLTYKGTILKGPGAEGIFGNMAFHARSDGESRIPRFLLNDIVRFWRTMCVDFAYKDWEQAGKKWALRNIKLRTSRKILFVAGFLTVFSCFQNPSLRRDPGDNTNYLLKLQTHLLSFVHSTPLNILVWALRDTGLDTAAVELLDSYEQFLALINDSRVRAHLDALTERAVYDDSVFLECREISHRLQAALRKVFFDLASPLREFTCEYGVF